MEADYVVVGAGSAGCAVAYRLAEAGRSADWAIDYHALVLPTLVITGLQDHVFLEPDVVSELSAQLPHAQRIDMPDAGHLIPMERPQALTTHLLNFAKEI